MNLWGSKVCICVREGKLFSRRQWCLAPSSTFMRELELHDPGSKVTEHKLQKYLFNIHILEYFV